MVLDFPSKVINSREFEPILRHVSSCYADVYDLEEYERASRGAGKIIWDMICAQRDFHEAQKMFEV